MTRLVASIAFLAGALIARPALAQVWLDHVNDFRRSAGLPTLTENATWSAGDAAHAYYMVKTGIMGHSEDPTNPYYTAAGDTAARNSNVMWSSSPSYPDTGAIDMWMAGPFHAVGIIDPRLAATGFGSYRESGARFGMAAALDVLRGRTATVPPSTTFPIMWPGKNQRVPLGSYTGGESPDPLSSCAGYTVPTGLPLVAQFGAGSANPVVTASSFSENGAALAHCVFSESTYVNPNGSTQSTGRSVLGSRDAVVLIPRAPLVTGHVYTASLTVNGTAHTWTFGIGAFGTIAPVEPTDADGDTLPDAWEAVVGLRSDSSTGADGAAGDPDGDGQTNAQEHAAGTHPNGCRSCTRYLAEGATGTFFSTRIALFNPEATTAHVWMRHQKGDGTVATHGVIVPPATRVTVNPAAAAAGMAQAEFSTSIESDRAVVVDRTMTWDGRGYGAHAETAVALPSMRWYFAEGATHSGFELFYLLQNASLTETATVRVRFLLPSGTPLVRDYDVAPNTRRNIWVDEETWNGVARLANTDVSADIEVTNGVPIIVERAMYQSTASRTFEAGHGAAGVSAPATSWFLAEGATGAFFDLFVLVANPDAARTARVRASYLLPDGTAYQKVYDVAPSSRYTVWVDHETFTGVAGTPLASADVSTTVESLDGVPIVVERAMWWPGPTASTWHESHVSAGATATGTLWAVADGESGGASRWATYVLVANTSVYGGSVRLTAHFEDGTSAATVVALPARSRTTFDMAAVLPPTSGRRFATTVESLGGTPAQIVVERAMYADALGQAWAAGTAALATRVR